MADKPLFTLNAVSEGAEALADLLLSGLDERPIWGRFLEACAARCQADAAAFIFEPVAGAAHDLVVVARGPGANDFLNGHASLETLRGFPLGELTEDDSGDKFSLILTMQMDDARRSYFILRSPGGGVSLAPDCAALVLSLQPLLERVSRHFLTIGNLVRRLSVMDAVLESGGVGVVLVSADGSVILTNAVADAILRSNRGLKNTRGRLSADSREDQNELADRIKDCAEKQGPEVTHEAWLPLAISRDNEEHPITALVRPGPPFAPLTAPLIRTAIVILRDPARRDFVQAAALERLFGLTPAEARLASLLANGLSVEDAAVQLGVTRNTVRTQLQAVFAKTRTRRQGDLIRLILSTTAVD